MLKEIKLSIGILVICLSAIFYSAQAQSNIDVNSLSDQQIQTLVQQASQQGLSMEQAIQMAKAQGATQSQIDQLTKRINGSNSNGNTDAKSNGNSNKNQKGDNRTTYSTKADIETNAKIKKIFGFQLFNSENLTFEPSVNIPIPKDYVLGVNDELTINISGASQQIYELAIDANGAIYIPGVGPIYLQGINFEEARRMIKRRLTSIYYGMSGSTPNTWADVSITNLRSIKVNVIGEVMAPGTYTLPATASAFNALYLSGGPNENGSFRNIRVIRNDKVIKLVDVYEYLLNGEAKSNIALRDQDIIYIPTYECRVDVEGAFKRNGFYELKKGEPLNDLIRFAGGFSSNAYKTSLSVSRITETQRKVLDVNSKQYPVFLPENGDSITAGVVLNRFENRVSITGAVFRPGTYSLLPDMKLSDLIQKAQGLKENVFTNRGLLIRLGKDLTPSSLSFDVSDIKSGKSDIVLQREDSVIIQDITGLREKRFVRIFGEVQNEGEYPYNEQMTINDLIFQAGGLKEAASESFIEISRRHSYQDAASLSNSLVELFQFKINRDLRLMDSDKRFIMSAFDYVYVRKAPSYFEQKTVSIEGEVLYPGQYSIRSKNEKISDLIRRAGGLTPHAYVKGATLFRNPEKEMQDTSIFQNLRKDTLMSQATEHLTNGRVEIQLDKIMKDTTCLYNYHLKESDRILIPEISEEVRVAGAILNPVGLAYEPRRSAKYYIDRSGGFSDNANNRKVYVIYSDGTTKVAKSFIGTRYPLVQPGSKIIVPEKAVKQRTDSTKWLALASTFASIAVAIATIFR